MVRGRTTAEVGLVLGHEITGEVIEAGDVETFEGRRSGAGALNVAVDAARPAQHTGVCLNASVIGGAYGYVDMGGWIGGRAEYVLVLYADFTC